MALQSQTPREVEVGTYVKANVSQYDQHTHQKLESSTLVFAIITDVHKIRETCDLVIPNAAKYNTLSIEFHIPFSQIQPVDEYTWARNIIYDDMGKETYWKKVTSMEDRSQVFYFNCLTYEKQWIKPEGFVHFMTEPYSEKEIIWKGWVSKEGSLYKNWKKRWFELHRNGDFQYYIDEKRNARKGQGNITVGYVNYTEVHDGHGTVVFHTTNRDWNLRFVNRADMEFWFNFCQKTNRGSSALSQRQKSKTKSKRRLPELGRNEPSLFDHGTENTSYESEISKFFTLIGLVDNDDKLDIDRFRHKYPFAAEFLFQKINEWQQNGVKFSTMHLRAILSTREDIQKILKYLQQTQIKDTNIQELVEQSPSIPGLYNKISEELPTFGFVRPAPSNFSTAETNENDEKYVMEEFTRFDSPMVISSPPPLLEYESSLLETTNPKDMPMPRESISKDEEKFGIIHETLPLINDVPSYSEDGSMHYSFFSHDYSNRINNNVQSYGSGYSDVSEEETKLSNATGGGVIPSNKTKIHSCWIKKKAGVMTTWKRRFLIYYVDKSFEYYTSDDLKELKGEGNFGNIQQIQEAGLQVTITTPERIWHFQFDDMTQRDIFKDILTKENDAKIKITNQQWD